MHSKISPVSAGLASPRESRHAPAQSGRALLCPPKQDERLTIFVCRLKPVQETETVGMAHVSLPPKHIQVGFSMSDHRPRHDLESDELSCRLRFDVRRLHGVLSVPSGFVHRRRATSAQDIVLRILRAPSAESQTLRTVRSVHGVRNDGRGSFASCCCRCRALALRTSRT